MSRALYNMSKTASDVEAKKMIFEAYDLLAKALEIKEDHYAVHKWISILLDAKSSYKGTKERIHQLYNVKNHMLVNTKISNLKIKERIHDEFFFFCYRSIFMKKNRDFNKNRFRMFR